MSSQNSMSGPMSQNESSLARPIQKIVIAGASGFVGRALIEILRTQYDIIALSRSPARIEPAEGSKKQIEWRQCDLFSLLETEAGVQGADMGFYLVHSMMPSARLSQGTFDDFDLIVADNFRRAAEKFNLQQIIYLGGIIPNTPQMSRHLQSRLEVEDVFIDQKIPVTILRAAMIIGARGSSFQIMLRLVERLPILICPEWTTTPSQPVALTDVIQALCTHLGKVEKQTSIYDVAGPEVLSYLEMMKRTAKKLGKNRIFLRWPLMTPQLSRLWVTLITGAPKDLIQPLIESLRCQMVADASKKLEIPGHQFLSFDEALTKTLQDRSHSQKDPKAFHKADVSDKEVRSVQRLTLPIGWNAEQAARAYMLWLPKLMPWFVAAEIQGQRVYISARWPHINMLILQYSPERSSPRRQLFYIRGGLLSRSDKKARLEFREVLGGTALIAAIHNFKPAFPWYIYRWTQAHAHLWVMKKFEKYLVYKKSVAANPVLQRTQK